MKELFRRLASPPTLKKSDLILTLVPAVLWWLAVAYGRDGLIAPSCVAQPAKCSSESVLRVDRVSLGMESGTADLYSFYTQNLSGALAFMAPLALHGGRIAAGAISPNVALAAATTDLVILLQATAWNGVFTEASHLVSQRPRPFVYSDPAARGAAPAHYTSFYSGHTSFSAVATTTLLITLISYAAPSLILVASALLMPVLILTTAACRVLAGRHFITDVLSGAIAGILVALIVALAHRRKSTLPPGSELA